MSWWPARCSRWKPAPGSNEAIWRAAAGGVRRSRLPTTISTDLNVFNVDHPVVSLAETMSKVWALGVPLEDVVAMTTLAPATVVHREGALGVLAEGRTAEVSVLRIEEGTHELSDGYETIIAEQRLVPVGCLRAGEWIEADAA